MQLRAARYANPLTGLPGNVPINENIERLLLRKSNFTACYCDLDHFKPYNDAYGYCRGDDLIQFVGKLLVDVASGEYDFVGHIGGDDFMLLLQSADWYQRLQQGIKRFDAEMHNFVDKQHILDGGYYGEDRKGVKVFHRIPSLSIGCLTVTPGIFNNHHEVSSAVVDAKKQAKKMPGSDIFIERRSSTS
ncbi:diguanylate cyclase, partial [Achromatium sp. WMS1]